jgi:aldose sugar dehydrogenase
MNVRRWLTLAGLIVPLGAGAQAIKTEEHSFRVVKVVEGLEHPWSVAFLPDGRMLVTERAGRLRVVKDGKLEARPVQGLPQVTEHGQGGLHDVVPHPQFAAN